MRGFRAPVSHIAIVEAYLIGMRSANCCWVNPKRFRISRILNSTCTSFLDENIISQLERLVNGFSKHFLLFEIFSCVFSERDI